MAKTITRIPASVNRYTAKPIAEKTKRRVAGYARVSTEHEEQATSYEAQMDYYTNYISANPDWIFVGMYSDEGIPMISTERSSTDAITNMPMAESAKHLSLDGNGLLDGLTY